MIAIIAAVFATGGGALMGLSALGYGIWRQFKGASEPIESEGRLSVRAGGKFSTAIDTYLKGAGWREKSARGMRALFLCSTSVLALIGGWIMTAPSGSEVTGQVAYGVLTLYLLVGSFLYGEGLGHSVMLVVLGILMYIPALAFLFTNKSGWYLVHTFAFSLHWQLRAQASSQREESTKVRFVGLPDLPLSFPGFVALDAIPAWESVGADCQGCRPGGHDRAAAGIKHREGSG